MPPKDKKPKPHKAAKPPKRRSSQRSAASDGSSSSRFNSAVENVRHRSASAAASLAELAEIAFLEATQRASFMMQGYSDADSNDSSSDEVSDERATAYLPEIRKAALKMLKQLIEKYNDIVRDEQIDFPKIPSDELRRKIPSDELRRISDILGLYVPRESKDDHLLLNSPLAGMMFEEFCKNANNYVVNKLYITDNTRNFDAWMQTQDQVDITLLKFCALKIALEEIQATSNRKLIPIITIRRKLPRRTQPPPPAPVQAKLPQEESTGSRPDRSSSLPPLPPRPKGRPTSTAAKKP